eukprot:CAMPEP_0195099050 /NCGR_PEP_ID=MMETSP0448-20130528/58045_1 /TAXON_ID=66468 /ORGANISM="Heterocapsa triquestra, Strain CCMP 448" /LENGTH=123 /DNA_ID=CAMNT_0040133871 /DNA_START=8 /DNA_END=376 /DNA_ORIENTATION=-
MTHKPRVSMRWVRKCLLQSPRGVALMHSASHVSANAALALECMAPPRSSGADQLYGALGLTVLGLQVRLGELACADRRKAGCPARSRNGLTETNLLMASRELSCSPEAATKHGTAVHAGIHGA